MYPPRQGPRPLPLHLMIQACTLLASLAALPNLKNGLLSLKSASARGIPEVDRQALERVLENLSPEAQGRFAAAVSAEAVRRHRTFVDGVTAYRTHRYHRPETSYPVIWQDGSTRLLDCRLKGQTGPAVLLIPSLINRSYILDLTPRYSLIRGLARRGVSPFLLDWDAPGEDERDFTVSDYVTRRIEPALKMLHQMTGGPVALLGYCMGGLLALAQAMHSPALVSGMVLLATPWDFHKGFDVPRAFLAPLWNNLHQFIDAQGHLPVDFLQFLFTIFDPDLTARKYSHFQGLPSKSSLAKEFVRLEDWANDGVPLVQNVAKECLQDWYLNNAPSKGLWQVDGQAIVPEKISCPSLVIVPERDRIVTPASALALSHCLPECTSLHVTGGHVGMLLSRFVGSRVHAPIAASVKTWAGVASQK